MIKIGLTGTLGSGKTTVLEAFAARGAATWSADEAVRRVLETDEALGRVIRTAFGPGVFAQDRVDRRRLAAVVFASRAKLSRLNRLLHPLVKKQLMDFLGKNKRKRVVVAEVPLLFETDFYKLFDVTVCVVTRASTQRKRLLQSGRLTPRDIARRMRHQLPLSRKIARCDMTIDNNGTKMTTIRQVKTIMEEETWKSLKLQNSKK